MAFEHLARLALSTPTRCPRRPRHGGHRLHTNQKPVRKDSGCLACLQLGLLVPRPFLKKGGTSETRPDAVFYDAVWSDLPRLSWFSARGCWLVPVPRVTTSTEYRCWKVAKKVPAHPLGQAIGQGHAWNRGELSPRQIRNESADIFRQMRYSGVRRVLRQQVGGQVGANRAVSGWSTREPVRQDSRWQTINSNSTCVGSGCKRVC